MKPLLPLFLLAMSSLALAQVGPSEEAAGTGVAGSFEDDCRSCHDSGVPDLHHVLYGQAIVQDSVVPFPDATGDGVPESSYGCLNCHDSSLTVVRNCVACHSSPAGTVPDGTSLEEPLTVSSTALGALTLSWGPSCELTDSDYSVYEGTLGDFSTHSPILCSTAGYTSAAFALPAYDAYYLVVAHNHWSEGSYGVDGDGGQRPASAAACFSQTIGCPWP